MLTLTPQDIDAIADAVALRLQGGEVRPAPPVTGLSDMMKAQIRDLAIAAVAGGRKRKIKKESHV